MAVNTSKSLVTVAVASFTASEALFPFMVTFTLCMGSLWPCLGLHTVHLVSVPAPMPQYPPLILLLGQAIPLSPLLLVRLPLLGRML